MSERCGGVEMDSLLQINIFSVDVYMCTWVACGCEIVVLRVGLLQVLGGHILYGLDC
jgi:hypothetical protein